MDFLTFITDWKFVWAAMAIIVFLFTNICKIPIKYFTNKIQDERKRRIANTTILLLPFAFSFALNFIYCEYLNTNAIFYVADCIRYAVSGIAIYGLVERFFKVKLENPWQDTEEGQNVMEGITEITEKTKVKEKSKKTKSKEQNEAIDKFYDKLNSENK